MQSVHKPNDYRAESVVHTSYLKVIKAGFEAVRYYESEEQVLHTYNKNQSVDHADKYGRYELNGTKCGE